MKIDRTALLMAAHNAIKAEREAHENRVARYEEAKAAHKAAWIARSSQKWAEACVKIQDAIANGEPVTKDLLPTYRTSRYDSSQTVSTYVDSTSFTHEGRDYRKPGEYQPNRDLTSIIAILEVVTDDELSTTGLRAVGVNPTTFRDLIQSIARING